MLQSILPTISGAVFVYLVIRKYIKYRACELPNIKLRPLDPMEIIHETDLHLKEPDEDYYKIKKTS